MSGEKHNAVLPTPPTRSGDKHVPNISPAFGESQNQASSLGKSLNPEREHRGLQRILEDRNMPFRIAPLLLVLSLIFLCFFNLHPVNLDGLSGLLASLVKHSLMICLFGLGAGIVLATGEVDLSAIGVGTMSGVLFGAIYSFGATNGVPSLYYLFFAVAGALLFAISSGALVSFCFLKLRVPMLIFTWALGSTYVILSIIVAQYLPQGGIHSGSGVGIPWVPRNFWEFGHLGFWISITLIVASLAFITASNLPARAAAVGANKMSAVFAGVRVDRTYSQAFLTNALLSCAAGILHGLYLTTASTRDMMGSELVAVSVAVLGGTSMGGGYLCMPAIVAAAFFWGGSVKMLAPRLPDLVPSLGFIQAEIGELLYFAIFLVISLLFGRLLAPRSLKIIVNHD